MTYYECIYFLKAKTEKSTVEMDAKGNESRDCKLSAYHQHEVHLASCTAQKAVPVIIRYLCLE